MLRGASFLHAGKEAFFFFRKPCDIGPFDFALLFEGAKIALLAKAEGRSTFCYFIRKSGAS